MMIEIELFLFFLCFVSTIFFSFSAPSLVIYPALFTLAWVTLVPRKLPSGGRDWIGTSPAALVTLAMAALWLSGNQQIARWLYYSYCGTVYLQRGFEL